MKDDLRYNPTDCFSTFARPTSAGMGNEEAKQYAEHRDAVMCRHGEGLTSTYNRFHDPDERSPEILKLRELHAAMDRAVLEAYGWHDLAERATCKFLLDYEDDEEDDDEPATPAAALAKSPGATAGPTTSATKSSPASSTSTNSAPNKNASSAKPPRKRKAAPPNAKHPPHLLHPRKGSLGSSRFT